MPLALGTAAFFLFLALPRVAAQPALAGSFVGAGLVLVAAELLLWARSRAGAPGFRIQKAPLVKSHFVQGAVQLCIYAYWGWYWRDVYAEMPLIGAQFVFLTLFDAVLSWWRRRPWRISLAALPIVLSTNVFLWFRDEHFAWQFVLLVTAALSKEFLKWDRDGRRTHIFNPSAFALGLFSLVLIATESTDLTNGPDIAITLFRPPHIYLEIFLLGVVVQWFFGVTMMTLAAAAMLVLLNVVYTATTGLYYFIDTNIAIAVFLGFHLLVTDPRTSPGTHAGKLMFGALYGLAIWVLYAILSRLGAPQFYDKLLPIPMLNLCVRFLDRIAVLGPIGAFNRWEASFSPRRLNYAHMGLWAVLFSGMLATGFVEAPHEGGSLAFWRAKVDEGRPGAGERLLHLVETRAARGSPSAANALGALYAEGELVPRDLVRAEDWFERACEGGDVRGCAHVVEQSLAGNPARSPGALEGALASLEAACPGDETGEACVLAALAYELGHGRERDGGRAATLYGLGLARGNLHAAKGLLRVRLAQRADPGDVGDAVAVLERAAQAGDGESWAYLARLAHEGLGVPHDEARANALLERACSAGWKEACAAHGPLVGH